MIIKRPPSWPSSCLLLASRAFMQVSNKAWPAGPNPKNADGYAIGVAQTIYCGREAMFGPQHSRASGWGGTQGLLDTSLVGFGPHGTAGDVLKPVEN